MSEIHRDSEREGATRDRLTEERDAMQQEIASDNLSLARLTEEHPNHPRPARVLSTAL
jgi:hypothetical protein